MAANNAPSSSSSETAQRAGIAGFVCAFVSTSLHPLDVIKIRLQNQRKGGSGSEGIAYKGMVSGIVKVYRQEGLQGLSKGLFASILREISYSSIRIGAYEPIRNILSRGKSTQDTSPPIKFVSAFLSGNGGICYICTAHLILDAIGGTGAALANPFDLMKTRFQSVLPHEAMPYPSTVSGLVSIYRTQGIAGLYKGCTVTAARAAILTSAQLGSYDTIKNNALVKLCGMEEGVALHLAASLLAGVITTTASNPVDVIKSRYMSDLVGSKYHNPLHCAVVSYRSEGVRVFLQGWAPAYCRIGPHTVFSLIMIEKIRGLLGLGGI